MNQWSHLTTPTFIDTVLFIEGIMHDSLLIMHLIIFDHFIHTHSYVLILFPKFTSWKLYMKACYEMFWKRSKLIEKQVRFLVSIPH